MRWFLFVGLLVGGLLVGCSGGVVPVEDPLVDESDWPSDLVTAPVVAGTVIPGSYIVSFADESLPFVSAEEFGGFFSDFVTSDGDLTLLSDVELTPLHIVGGFAVRGLSEEGARVLALDPRVARIEPDQVVTVAGTQLNAPWGVDRVDQRSLPLSGTYSFGLTGVGVSVFVVDTGIRASHVDFGGRVRGGYSVVDDGFGTMDCDGHGTHVAGTVGGLNYGVAKGVTLVPVRVLGCDGYGSLLGVVEGLDWIRSSGPRPGVVNMSLTAGGSSYLDQSVRNLHLSGVPVVVAAGNSARTACVFSPARETTAITVGASDRFDKAAAFSNLGPCLDLFAPGVGIVSAYADGDSSFGSMSGTSMAAPHVAGIAALHLQAMPSASADAVTQAILSSASSVYVSLYTMSPHLLAYVNPALGGATPPPPPVTEPEPEPAPEPTPEPAPTVPCTTCITANQTVGVRGVFTTPNVTPIVNSTLEGWAVVPGSTGWEFHLDRLSGGNWVYVATSSDRGPLMKISVPATRGVTYRWRVQSTTARGDVAVHHRNVLTGSVTRAGRSYTLPSFSVSRSTSLSSVLEGPSGTNFDLYLERYANRRWSAVASGVTAGSNEDVSFNASPGTYRWRVFARMGTGAFNLTLR